METLCKLYLELAKVVPETCISAREVAIQKHIDRRGVALQMIDEGYADAVGIARATLADNLPAMQAHFEAHQKARV